MTSLPLRSKWAGLHEADLRAPANVRAPSAECILILPRRALFEALHRRRNPLFAGPRSALPRFRIQAAVDTKVPSLKSCSGSTEKVEKVPMISRALIQISSEHKRMLARQARLGHLMLQFACAQQTCPHNHPSFFTSLRKRCSVCIQAL